MSNRTLLMKAMAEECKDTILEWNRRSPDLPKSLRPNHLLWMCDQIVQHASDWPETKLHRWVGFVQGAMIANRMINLDGAKAMFDKAKNAFGELDEDLLDHLDPDDFFELDLGGQG